MPYRAHAKYLLLCRVAFKPFPPPTQRLRIGPCAQQLSLGTFTFTQGYQTKMLVANRHMISWFHIYQYKQIQSWLTKNEMVYHFILWTLFAEIIPKKHSFFKIRIFLEPMFAFKRVGSHDDLFCCGSISKIWTNMDKHILKIQCTEALEQSSISFAWSVLVWRVNVKFLGWPFVGEVNTSPKHKTPDGRPKYFM